MNIYIYIYFTHIYIYIYIFNVYLDEMVDVLSVRCDKRG